MMLKYTHKSGGKVSKKIDLVVHVVAYFPSKALIDYLQGLSVPFACVGSGDPVRVLRLYTTNTLDILLKHLLLRHMYNLPLPMLMCYVLKPYALRLPTDGCSPVKC